MQLRTKIRDVTDSDSESESQSESESDGIRHFFQNSKSDGYLKSDCGGFKIFVLVQLYNYFRN